MHARSALFDLYGDHLEARGGHAPVAALVRLLAPLDIAAPAVRTAVSRMVRQGWLAPVALREGPGYLLTARGRTRVAHAGERIYRVGLPEWDGTWHLLVVDGGSARRGRDRVRAGLRFLGYAQLADGTWVAPRASAEAPALLAAEGVSAAAFGAHYEGADLAGLVARAWDLDALGASYDRWLQDVGPLVDLVPAGSEDRDDRTAYAVRSRLVHEWRKFLFTDPGLPAAVLPDRWPGDRAAAFFSAEAERLRPAADRFVTGCLSVNGLSAR